MLYIPPSIPAAIRASAYRSELQEMSIRTKQVKGWRPSRIEFNDMTVVVDGLPLVLGTRRFQTEGFVRMMGIIPPPCETATGSDLPTGHPSVTARDGRRES